MKESLGFTSLQTVQANSGQQAIQSGSSRAASSLEVEGIVLEGNWLSGFVRWHSLHFWVNKLCANSQWRQRVPALCDAKYTADFVLPHATQCNSRLARSLRVAVRSCAAAHAVQASQRPGTTHALKISSARAALAPKPAGG